VAKVVPREEIAFAAREQPAREGGQATAKRAGGQGHSADEIVRPQSAAGR